MNEVVQREAQTVVGYADHLLEQVDVQIENNVLTSYGAAGAVLIAAGTLAAEVIYEQQMGEDEMGEYLRSLLSAFSERISGRYASLIAEKAEQNARKNCSLLELLHAHI